MKNVKEVKGDEINFNPNLIAKEPLFQMRISPQVHLLVEKLHQEYPSTEWACFCRIHIDENKVHHVVDAYFPKQKIASATVEITDEGFTDFMNYQMERFENDPTIFDEYNCIMHSHHGMSCFWSGVDNAQKYRLHNGMRKYFYAIVTAYNKVCGKTIVSYKGVRNQYLPFFAEIEAEMIGIDDKDEALANLGTKDQVKKYKKLVALATTEGEQASLLSEKIDKKVMKIAEKQVAELVSHIEKPTAKEKEEFDWSFFDSLPQTEELETLLRQERDKAWDEENASALKAYEDEVDGIKKEVDKIAKDTIAKEIQPLYEKVIQYLEDSEEIYNAVVTAWISERVQQLKDNVVHPVKPAVPVYGGSSIGYFRDYDEEYWDKMKTASRGVRTNSPTSPKLYIPFGAVRITRQRQAYQFVDINGEIIEQCHQAYFDVETEIRRRTSLGLKVYDTDPDNSHTIKNDKFEAQYDGTIESWMQKEYGDKVIPMSKDDYILGKEDFARGIDAIYKDKSIIWKGGGYKVVHITKDQRVLLLGKKQLKKFKQKIESGKL